jgi:hypothetical protein
MCRQLQNKVAAAADARVNGVIEGICVLAHCVHDELTDAVNELTRCSATAREMYV